MNTRTLIGATMTAVLLSTAAFAATMKPEEQCTALEKQFDQEITKHATAAKAAEAKTLRTDGGKMCQSGKHDDGIKKLKEALEYIGVKPAS